jgi:hypothetical protein
MAKPRTRGVPLSAGLGALLNELSTVGIAIVDPLHRTHRQYRFDDTLRLRAAQLMRRPAAQHHFSNRHVDYVVRLHAPSNGRLGVGFGWARKAPNEIELTGGPLRRAQPPHPGRPR